MKKRAAFMALGALLLSIVAVAYGVRMRARMAHA